MPASHPSLPTSRDDFEIAIMCALPLEADAVVALFDKRWDSQTYRKTSGDTNTYSTGAIGRHNVVLVHLPNMGKVAAATAAAFLRASYEGIKLALVVGICGGVPSGKSSNDKIFLGDVVISDGIIQYDFGRQFPHGFVRKDHVRDNLPRPSLLIRTFLAMLQAEQTRRQLQEQTLEYLDTLQRKRGIISRYPSSTEDWLFRPTYRHRHTPSKCTTCGNGPDGVCDTALKLSCQELECDERELVFRELSESPLRVPIIHFGLVASGNSVMKSGEDRDKAASRDGFIAFEMEGAGIWETFPNCLIIKGVCDYADSHKSKKWQAYAAVTAAAAMKAVLESWDTGPANSLQSYPTHHLIPADTDRVPIDPARRVPILKALYTSPYRARKERNPDRVMGTCEWFVTHKYFQQWRENPSSSMLLVSADPGCGKSVLAKYLVDSELPTTKFRTTCYFFFKDDFADQRSARSALCCILHQLFEQREILLSNKIAQRFESNGEDLTNSFVELWDVLITASQDQNAGEIVCILDAFDECDDEGQSEFTRYLGRLYGTRNHFNIKFLVTSRPYGSIRRGFQPLEIPGLPVIRLRGETETEMSKITKEIDIYIRTRVQNIRASLRLSLSEEDVLLQGLLRIPHRTYLWAYLTLDVIENDINLNVTRICHAISHLPQTVDEAYERILARSRNTKEAKKLLQIVIAAARPLTLSEMNLALTIRENHRSYRELDLQPEDRFCEYVRDLCGLFVIILNSKIFLLHQTAKEFLIQDEGESYPKNNSNQIKWKSSLCERDSHHVLSQICIWHLLFVEFEEWSTLKEIRSGNLFDYSAKNWASHVRISRIDDNATIRSLLDICGGNSRRFLAWFTIYWNSVHDDIPPRLTILMVASYFGLGQLVKFLLESNRTELNMEDVICKRSALSWASENGFNDVVKLLLNANKVRFKDIIKLSFAEPIKLEAKDNHGRTALSYAVRKGHVAVVKQLVKKGARVDSEDENRGTPISYALCHGNKSLISLLLNKEDEGDSVRNILRQLMLTAARRGDTATVKLLIENGEDDVNSQDCNGRTPLSLVAAGSKATTELLLKSKKVDVNLQDNTGRTPLSWAAAGSRATTELLLQSSKVDVNLQDVTGRTPLSWAVASSRATTELLLQSSKVDVNLQDVTGRTPLSWAVASSRATTELLLQSSKVDVNLQDVTGRTPLSWAVASSRATTKLLLQSNKVDVNLQDVTGRTLLSWAAAGSRDTTELLLQNSKVDVNLQDNTGRTPLLLAIATKSKATIELLVQSSKADFNLQDNTGRTPLSWAASTNAEATAELLIQSSRVDVNSQDHIGRTPLSWAASTNAEATTKLLIQNSRIDVNLQDHTGRTPLSWAASTNAKATAEILIQSSRVDVNLQDNTGRTPLSWAASTNAEATAELLIQSSRVDVNSQDHIGRTPLTWATSTNAKATTKLLTQSSRVDASSQDRNISTLGYYY